MWCSYNAQNRIDTHHFYHILSLCACSDVGDVLSDIFDDKSTASSQFNVIHFMNISSLCLQSASRSYYTIVLVVPTSTMDGCLAWYNVLLILCITRVWNTISLGICWNLIFLVCCYCDFLHINNMLVHYLLASLMLALCFSWLYFNFSSLDGSVELTLWRKIFTPC